MNLTPAARIARAEHVVREQRDPDGDRITTDFVPRGAVEAFLIQELERLQRAVMGEPTRSAPLARARADL